MPILARNGTSRPKGNDRSPESKQVFLKSSQVSKIFFQSVKGSYLRMIGPNSDVNQGPKLCCKFAKNDTLQSQHRTWLNSVHSN